MSIKKLKNQYSEVRLLNAEVELPLKQQKGSVIFLVILVLAGILVATIGINNLVVNGIKFSRNIAWSAPAYFAAETGMEKALYDSRKENCKDGFIPGNINGSFNLNGQEAKWKVTFKCGEELIDCAGDPISDTKLTIKSTGSFREVNRSIQVSFPLTCQ